MNFRGSSTDFFFIYEEQWSPEQIAGRLKLEKTNLSISYPTIYRDKGLFDTKAEKKSRGNKGAIENKT